MSIEAMRQALEHVQEFKRRWWAVPPFGNKVNKATREAVSAALSPIFQIEDVLRAAIDQAEKPTLWYHSVSGRVRFDGAGLGRNWVPLYTATRQEPYDQTSLELCEECGWKALIRGDGCLVCARQKAKPVAYVDQRIHGWPDCFVMEPDPPHTVPLYTEPPTDSEPFAYSYMGIRQDGSTHGPHLVWKPEYMDAMSASKGAVAIPLYTTPRQWVGLTDEEIEDEWERVTGHSIVKGDRSDGRTMFLSPDEVVHYTQAIESKLKELNT